MFKWFSSIGLEEEKFRIIFICQLFVDVIQEKYFWFWRQVPTEVEIKNALMVRL